MSEFNLQAMSAEDVSVLHNRLRSLVESAGWPQFQGVMAHEVSKHLSKLTGQPTPNDTADNYALRKADTAGYLRGLRFAQEQPHKLLQRAETVLLQHQAAAEQAAKE